MWIRKILIKLIILWSSIFLLSTWNSFAWMWLVAQNWDILSTTKWNEMINVLLTKIWNIINIGNGEWIFAYSNSWTWYFKSISWGNHISVTSTPQEIVISFTGWISSNPIPYIKTSSPFIFATWETKTITIIGDNFIPTSTAYIPGFDGSIDSISVISPYQMDLTITAWNSTWTYDLVVSNWWVLNTLWSWNGQGLIEVTNQPINIDLIYNIAANAATRDDMKNQVLSIDWIELVAIPITNAVAERMTVRNVPGDNLNDWEISLQYRYTTWKEAYIVYYLDDNFQFVTHLVKSDNTTSTLDEFADATYTSYDYTTRYWTNYYTGTCNFNYSINTSRNRSAGSYFSSDDGGFGFADWDITFNTPGPYIRDVAGSWWFGNMNSSDTNANNLYINWTANNGTVTSYMFINTNP